MDIKHEEHLVKNGIETTVKFGNEQPIKMKKVAFIIIKKDGEIVGMEERYIRI